ncbi:MAG: SDR family NAD(P)-dependent oxidoreductase, partial [Bdellovibrionales bacterium]
MSRRNKTILITGASSGIGEALAYSYAQEGCCLLLTGTNEVRLNKVSEKCKDMGALVSAKIIDVRDQEALNIWLCEEDNKTPIDLVIANAGISGGTSGLEEEKLMSQIRTIYDVNVMGVLNTIEPVLNKMVERRKGQVAFMSSMASYAPWSGAPAYANSKTAVRYLGHALRGT